MQNLTILSLGIANVGSHNTSIPTIENLIVLPQLPCDRRKPCRGQLSSIHFTADTFKSYTLMQRFQPLSIATPTAHSSNWQLSSIHFTADTFKFHPLMQTRYKTLSTSPTAHRRKDSCNLRQKLWSTLNILALSPPPPSHPLPFTMLL